MFTICNLLVSLNYIDQHEFKKTMVSKQPSAAKQLPLAKNSSIHKSTTVTTPNVSGEEATQNVSELNKDLVCMDCKSLLNPADRGDGFCANCRQVQVQFAEESSDDSNGKEESPPTSGR